MGGSRSNTLLQRAGSMQDSEAQALSMRACSLEIEEGDVMQAGQLHLQAAQTAPEDGAVQAAMASHFVREHLDALKGDQQLAGIVADAFAVASTAECTPLGEYSVFLSQVVGDTEAAMTHFQRAVNESPDDADIRYNFGNFLDHALGKQLEAATQYEHALEADPEHGPTLNNFSALLIEQARNDPPNSDQQTARMARAHELLIQAEALAPGFPAYNLACLTAMAGEFAESERWLRVAYSSPAFEGLPSADQLKDDDDLACLCELEWFGRLTAEIADACGQGQPLGSETQPSMMDV